MYFDSRQLLTLFRGGQVVWLNEKDAAEIDIKDNNRGELSGTRAGTHNTPTRIHMKPTHMIGSYGQFSYGFNYYGPTGNQRDIYVIARKLEEVDRFED